MPYPPKMPEPELVRNGIDECRDRPLLGIIPSPNKSLPDGCPHVVPQLVREVLPPTAPSQQDAMQSGVKALHELLKRRRVTKLRAPYKPEERVG